MKAKRMLLRFSSTVLAMLALASAASAAEPKPAVIESPVFVDSTQFQWQKCEGLPGCTFLPLRGDAKREASAAIFRLEAGVRFPKHWHTSAEHILVMQGELDMNLENGARYRVGPRAFLYNPGGMIHWGQCAAGEACVYYVYDDQPYDIHLVQ